MVHGTPNKAGKLFTSSVAAIKASAWSASRKACAKRSKITAFKRGLTHLIWAICASTTARELIFLALMSAAKRDSRLF
jgi:hypothetical protein